MKVLNWLDNNFEKALSSILLAAATIIIALQIIFRTTGFRLDWTEEVARYFFVWIIYLGIANAVRQRAHISVDLLTTFAKPRGKFILAMISNVCFFVFAVIISYHGILLLSKIGKLGQVSPAVQIPMVVPYSSYVVGFILVIIRLVQDTKLRIKEEKLRLSSDGEEK